MLGGAVVVIAGGMAATAAARRREEEAYDKIKHTMDNLDEIVKAGTDVNIWTINTAVEGLPTPPSRWSRFAEDYMQPEETAEDYLKRVFERQYQLESNYFFPFLFYRKGNELIAKRSENENLIDTLLEDNHNHRKDFSLLFHISEPETYSEVRKMDLFKPYNTSLPSINADIEVRTHIYRVEYKEFVRDDVPLKDYRRIEKIERGIVFGELDEGKKLRVEFN